MKSFAVLVALALLTLLALLFAATEPLPQPAFRDTADGLEIGGLENPADRNGARGARHARQFVAARIDRLRPFAGEIGGEGR